MISNLHKQGLGRHSEKEINLIADKTFKSLSDILGDKTYFFGDKPCTFDATAFGFLAEFISVSLNNEMNGLARKYSNLVDYCNRIETQYYK
jgi:glutathione S-transferase